MGYGFIIHFSFLSIFLYIFHNWKLKKIFFNFFTLHPTGQLCLLKWWGLLSGISQPRNQKEMWHLLGLRLSTWLLPREAKQIFAIFLFNWCPKRNIKEGYESFSGLILISDIWHFPWRQNCTLDSRSSDMTQFSKTWNSPLQNREEL